MISTGALPLSEKVYLADKTLVSAQSLKVGDKLLSLKITEANINNIADIITNFIQKKQPVTSYELCDAMVYSIEKQDKTDFININNIKINPRQPIIVANYKNIDSSKKDKTPQHFLISTLTELEQVSREPDAKVVAIKNLNVDFSSNLIDLFNEEKIDIFNRQISKGFSYSLTITEGHFYFTENFIVLAWNWE